MGIDTKKNELIEWITKLKDPQSLDKMLNLKERLSRKKKDGASPIFGSGKHLIEHISDDFNEPLDAFKAYQQ